MDSPALAWVSFGGRQGSRSGEVAQKSLLSKNWCSVGTGQQGQDQKHYECSLFTRDSLGVDREKSNHQRSTKRETAERTRRSDSGRNHGIAEGIVGSISDDDRTGCLHGSAPGRIDRTP